MGSRSQSENPEYLQVVVAASTDNEASDGFYLSDSEFFGIEWELEAGANATGWDLKLQMECADGSWVDARDGDTASGTDKSALVAAETTLARGFIAPSPPYTRRKLRLVADNNNANEITLGFYIHRSRSRLK